MPLYSYTCAACGKECELLVATYAQRNQQKCPHCGAGKLKHELTSFSVGSARGGCGKSCGLSEPLPSCRPDACGMCRN